MSRPATAFVLGGGGLLGAAEVGQLAALLDAGITPDLVVGTSVGAVNGVVVAADPTRRAVDRLHELWSSMAEGGVFVGSTLRRVSTFARTGTHAHPVEPLREVLLAEIGDVRIEDLAVRFQCVAASVERAAEHWFTSGPAVEAVLASAAVPGLLPPVQIDGEHFLDGGLVHSIPVGRAVKLGAREIFVLHVGRIERPLTPPTKPWEVAMVALEIARRHRLAVDLAAVPEGVGVHILPTGDPDPPRYADRSVLRYRDASRVAERIRLAYEATARRLRDLDLGGR